MCVNSIKNGKIGIIHWRSDLSTPHEPVLILRPKSEQVIEWTDKTVTF
jgi:hypothetical protein